MAPVIAQPLHPESLVARIIAELQTNPEAQRMLLRAMLTNEFLGMPARLDRIERDVAELKIDVAALKNDVATLKNDVGYLKGSDLEMKIHRNIQSLLSQHLGLRRARIIRSGVLQAPEDFTEAIARAADEGRISFSQEQRITATDVILRAQRQRDRKLVWVAVEVANRLDAEDITRSRSSADTLTAVFGNEATPLIAGYRLDAADRERAAAAGVRYLKVAERL